MEYRYVRMNKYKRRIGQTAKTRTIRSAGKDYRIKIDPDTGRRPWHKVPLHIAKICEEMVVDPYRDGSPLCMEVCTEEEALELDAAAKRARLARKAREAPTVADAIDHTQSSDLSLSDVRSGTARSAAMAAATVPAGLPEEAKADAVEAAKAELKADFQADFAAFVEESKSQIESVKDSAREAAEASDAVIAKQGEEIAKLTKQLTAAAEHPPEKAAEPPPKKKRGRPPKKKKG